jgi:hypothetical protein
MANLLNFITADVLKMAQLTNLLAREQARLPKQEE